MVQNGLSRKAGRRLAELRTLCPRLRGDRKRACEFILAKRRFLLGDAMVELGLRSAEAQRHLAWFERRGLLETA